MPADRRSSGVGGEPRYGIRLPSWVGDVVAAIPSVRLMRHATEQLTCLGPGFAEDLMPRGVAFTPVSTRREERDALKQLELTHYLILKPSFGAALCARGRGRKTAGYEGHHRSWLLSFHLPQPTCVPKVEALLRLSDATISHWRLPLPAGVTTARWIDLEPGDTRAASNLVSGLGLSPGAFLVCCPVAAARSGDPDWKRWPHFRKLSETLNSAGIPHVVCPGPGETWECARRLPHALVIERTNLRQYAAILAVSGGAIANDTGPMHLAAAVGVTTVALFGDTSPDHFGGRPAANVRVLGRLDAWPRFEEVWNEVIALTTEFPSQRAAQSRSADRSGVRLSG